MLITNTRKKFESEYRDDKNSIIIGKNTIIEPNAVIYPNVTVGNDCIIATSSVLKSNTTIGEHSILGTLSNAEGNIKIGSWTTIQAQCYLCEGVNIGNNCFIGPLFMVANTKKIGFPGAKFGYPNTTDMPRSRSVIENNVQVGSRVSLMPGVTIGESSIVDAGSFITKSFPKGSHIRSSGIAASEL